MSTIEAETLLRCGVCNETSEVGVLEETETWHDIYCRTCGTSYSVTLKVEQTTQNRLAEQTGRLGDV